MSHVLQRPDSAVIAAAAAYYGFCAKAGSISKESAIVADLEASTCLTASALCCCWSRPLMGCVLSMRRWWLGRIRTFCRGGIVRSSGSIPAPPTKGSRLRCCASYALHWMQN